MVLLSLFDPWTWKMAWRDSRHGRGRLLLFSVSIMFGIAGLVAIGSLKENLVHAVEAQAKELVGSDVFISSQKPLAPAVEKLLRSSGAQVAREKSNIAMLQFPAAPPDAATLRVEARAVDPEFPFYGTPVTDPPDAWTRCMRGEGLVMDGTVLDQTGSRIGDGVKLGGLETRILGVFLKAPARASWAAAFGVIAPEVFYARSLSEKVGLDLGASFPVAFRTTFHRAHMQFPPGNDPEAWAAKYRETIKKSGADFETAERRRKNVGNILDHLYTFLSLLSFIALVLGGMGIASAIHVHALQRLPTVATLRCMGCSSSRAFAIFLAQGICLGLLGASGGVLIGAALQQWLPRLFKSYIPIEFEIRFDPFSAIVALGLGFLICVSFVLLPLLKVRRVSPLAAVRATIAEEKPRPTWLVWTGWCLWIAALVFWWHPWMKADWPFVAAVRHLEPAGYLVLSLLGAGLLVRALDPYWWLILLTLAGTLTWLAYSLSPPREPGVGLAFTVLLGCSLLVLAVAARLIVFLARLALRPAWPYVLRQGFLNLHRPRNQTLLFMLSGGLGVCLILTMVLVQNLLLAWVESKSLGAKSNLFFLNVKGDQHAALAEKLTAAGATGLDYAPLVTMKLQQIKGTALAELQKNPKTRLDGWIPNYEFRATFRATVGKGEKVIAGKLAERFSGSGATPVSIEKGIAERLKIGLGDEFTMAAEGKPLACRVTSIREIEWQELGLNPMLVFPPGTLDAFPHSGVMSARLTDGAKSALVLRQMLADPRLRSVFMFDVSEILETLNDIIDRIAFVIRFMAGFTIITGIIILAAVLVSGKRDRIEESVLLRTLGASRSQIWKILASEYALLGFLASLTGGVLAIFGTAFLAERVFKLAHHPWVVPCLVAIAIVSTFTTLVGILLSRGITSEPPLSILRGQ